MVSGPQRDLWVQLVASVTPEAEQWFFARREKAYAVSAEFTNASAGDTATLYLENPSGSGMTAVVPGPQASAAARSYIRVYDAFSGDPSGGTSVTVENNLLDSGGEGDNDAGDLVAERDVTFTATNTFYSTLIGEGVGEQSGAGRAKTTPFLLEPGRRIVVEAEKLVSGGDDVSMNIVWHERDRVLSQTNSDPTTNELVN